MNPRRMLITGGPTREPIDAVRFIANRSSGRMGVAIAQAASEAGWQVTLLMGPSCIAIRGGLDIRRFETTADLQKLLEECFPVCDVLVMAAAVADYRVASPSSDKIPRREGFLTLRLEPTPDLIAGCAKKRRQDQYIVGFSLEEPVHLERRARQKLKAKGINAIVANPIFTPGADMITAHVLTADGRTLTPDPQLSKEQFARWLVEWVGAEWCRLKEPRSP